MVLALRPNFMAFKLHLKYKMQDLYGLTYVDVEPYQHLMIIQSNDHTKPLKKYLNFYQNVPKREDYEQASII